MDELIARRVLLAQAIETADTQGGLLSEVERDQIDRQARHDAGVAGEERQAVAPEHFVDVRAQRVLATVQRRNPTLAAMQEPGSLRGWLTVGIPMAALVLGVLTDVIANPHRVDLVSLPLLGIVAWNLAMYLVLIGGWMLARRGRQRPLLAGLGRWTDGPRALKRRPGNLQSQVTALFHLRWYQATEALHIQRCKRVLHLAAAAWAVGVALSLLTRGLVVEYRVGWESTFLNAGQVHAILSFLRLPALLVFPFQPFTVQEVASLQFTQGGGVAGARWVYMYVALLLVLVVVPRVVLAAAAYARERMLARKVRVDLGDPYFQRLVSLLSSARVHLGLITHREEDRSALLRVLSQEPDTGRTLIRSGHDDVLRLIDLSGAPAPAPSSPASSAEAGWMGRLLGLVSRGKASVNPVGETLGAAREDCDVVLHVSGAAGDPAAAQPLLQWLGKPVLALWNRPGPPDPGQLPFDAFARCWVQERTLLDAIGRLLPQAKAAGFARIVTAWEARNQARFARAMAVLAEHLLYAARQVEEVRSNALTVKSLIPTERQAQSQARQAAMDAVVKRLDASASEMFSRLRKLHGLDDSTAEILHERMREKFVVQQAIDTPQAGMAGAATGAAMGASVDLLVGGLTLGAATALGALVGGSAAFIAAAWKNRATPGGATVIQLSDEMMQAMVEAALLRYLAVAHYGRGPAGAEGELQQFWKSDVVAAVEARETFLPPFWTAARTQPDSGRLAMALAHELETIARKVLGSLYTAA
ncbi:DUF3482 domain-containing protein [Caenimonas soli]|uniref:DUF3482 domain-containing protein n=1 Tax=Caenimonas soli TaxID=2735555 RepID=UPI001552E31E|nr:DUF3482 domain-containing protein [Caenimonas soli]NPC54096.1 DUF3482 domain-containing protein [Caenimonas soli]